MQIVKNVLYTVNITVIYFVLEIFIHVQCIICFECCVTYVTDIKIEVFRV